MQDHISCVGWQLSSVFQKHMHTHQPHHYTGHSVYTDGQRAGEIAAMAAPLPSMKQTDAVFLETRVHHLPMWLHSEQGLEHSGIVSLTFSFLQESRGSSRTGSAHICVFKALGSLMLFDNLTPSSIP